MELLQMSALSERYATMLKQLRKRNPDMRSILRRVFLLTVVTSVHSNTWDLRMERLKKQRRKTKIWIAKCATLCVSISLILELLER